MKQGILLGINGQTLVQVLLEVEALLNPLFGSQEVGESTGKDGSPLDHVEVLLVDLVGHKGMFVAFFDQLVTFVALLFVLLSNAMTRTGESPQHFNVLGLRGNHGLQLVVALLGVSFFVKGIDGSEDSLKRKTIY